MTEHEALVERQKAIGEAIRRKREALGWSRAKLAQECHQSKETILSIELARYFFEPSVTAPIDCLLNQHIALMQRRDRRRKRSRRSGAPAENLATALDATHPCTHLIQRLSRPALARAYRTQAEIEERFAWATALPTTQFKQGVAAVLGWALGVVDGQSIGNDAACPKKDSASAAGRPAGLARVVFGVTGTPDYWSAIAVTARWLCDPDSDDPMLAAERSPVPDEQE